MEKKVPYIHSKEFMEKVSKVGPDSDFAYRSIFDPVPSSELKESASANEGEESFLSKKSTSNGKDKVPYIHSKEFMEKVSKVGPDSDFAYRSIFDPVPSSELKENSSFNKKKE